MLEATVYRKIMSEYPMQSGFSLIQSDALILVPLPNPAMPSITNIDTLISANSMLHFDMEFFVSPAEARINFSKQNQVSAWDWTRCSASDNPLHLVTG